VAAPTDRLLRSLEWRVVRRLDGRLQGPYRTVFRGAGIDLAGLRQYVAEDDVRHIDWNVTARLDEPFVRLFTEDRDLTAWLVLDRSASMRFGRGEHGKDVVLTELAVSLARLMTQGGHRVGAILYDNPVPDRAGRERPSSTIVPPATGRTHVLRLTHELLRPVPETGPGRTTDVGAMLGLAAATIRRRSLVFLVSDFISDTDWERPLTRLAHRHEVVALRVVDPAEREIPDLGLVVVEDAETGEQVLADTSDPLFRRRLRDQVEAQEARIGSSLRQAGVPGHVVSTDDDLVETFVDLVHRSGQGPRSGHVSRRGPAPASGGVHR
jgi:uncharacterized protein (DUF58 family)